MLDTFPWQAMKAAALAPGGNVFTAGLAERNHLVGSLYTADGEFVWSTRILPTPLMAVEAAASRTGVDGRAEYYVGGHIHHGTIRTSDAAVIKLGPDGEVVWARYYANPGDDEIRGMTVTGDGHLVVAGFIRESVLPPSEGTPTGNGNVSAGGLLMKLDGETGDIHWATVCPAAWSMMLVDVVEGPGGKLFAGGEAPRPISLIRPSNLIARFSPEGALEAHVTVGSDPEWPNPIPGSGRTPYDTVHGLTWTPEGLVACGQSGLGTSVSAWVMGLTESLGVRFFSVFDGEGMSRFFEVADLGDGLGFIGEARSPYPVSGKDGQQLPWLVKLPMEGILRFSEESGYQSYYLQPWTHHSSANHEFRINSSVVYPRPTPGARPAEVFFGNTHGPAELEATALPWERLESLPPPVVVTNLTLYALEWGGPGNGLGDGIDPEGWPGFEEWAASRGLRPGTLPTDDTDGDGWVDGWEAFFDRDPRVSDSAGVITMTVSRSGAGWELRMTYPRSLLARTWDVAWETTEDLVTWSPAVGWSETSTPINADSERVTLSLPMPGEDPHRFYRLRGPGMGATVAGTIR